MNLQTAQLFSVKQDRHYTEVSMPWDRNQCITLVTLCTHRRCQGGPEGHGPP